MTIPDRDEDELREILAEELERTGQPGDAQTATLVRDKTWSPPPHSAIRPIIAAMRRARASSPPSTDAGVSEGLLKAAKAFLAKVDDLTIDINGATQIAALHGFKWAENRNWVYERVALQKAISAAERAASEEQQSPSPRVGENGELVEAGNTLIEAALNWRRIHGPATKFTSSAMTAVAAAADAIIRLRDIAPKIQAADALASTGPVEGETKL